MIARMRAAGDDRFGTESANRIATGVKAGVRSEAWTRASVAVWRVNAHQMDTGGCNVGSAEFHIVKIMIKTGGVCGDVSVAEIPSNAGDIRQLQLIPWRMRRNVSLKTINIKNGVRQHTNWIP